MKVRIRKPLSGGRHLKTGVMTVEEERGTYYRLDCEGCSTPLKLRNHPLQGEDTFCKECQNIADIGKPETRLVRHKGKSQYETPCDECGSPERTSFLPKRARDFLCNTCLKESQRKAAEAPASDQPGEVSSADSSTGAEEAGKTQTAEKVHSRPAPQKKYHVTCPKCRRPVVLKFQPNTKRPFLCAECYHTQQEDLRSEKPETRIWFNIECNDCGKQETLNFIPTFPERALCSSCFKKMQRRKNDTNR